MSVVTFKNRGFLASKLGAAAPFARSWADRAAGSDHAETSGPAPSRLERAPAPGLGKSHLQSALCALRPVPACLGGNRLAPAALDPVFDIRILPRRNLRAEHDRLGEGSRPPQPPNRDAGDSQPPRHVRKPQQGRAVPVEGGHAPLYGNVGSPRGHDRNASC